jgi:hypothetical protein
MDDMIPAEKLAAFIDGRLDESERAEVIAALARSAGAREVLADAVSVIHPASEGDAAATVRSGPRRYRWLRWSVPLAAAAGLTLIALDDPEAPLAGLLDAVEEAPTTLPMGWEAPGWTVTRGAEDGRATDLFRIGVRLVDLDVASMANDETARNRVALDLAVMLDRIGGAAALARPFEAIARGAPQGGRAIGDEIETVLAVLDDPAVRIGYELETARLAARLGRLDIAREAIARAAAHVDATAGDPDAAGLRARLALLDGMAAAPLAERLFALIGELGD